MCGLIFAASKWTLGAVDVDIFKKMLIADQFRGEHSTGVFSLYHPYGKDRYFNVVKEAMSGSEFANDIAFKKAVNGLLHATQVGNTITGINQPRVLFGHNRYATVGAVNAKNAHPFTHGHITLAHNGTLRNQSLLPDHKRFEVDSENIAYSVATIGIDETVKKLNGAFALIWYDDNEQTVNFLRNDEREFHLFEIEGGDWFGCSEEKMGEWLLTRGKTPKRIKRHFELEPGTQYVFDVSKGLELKEERKHELPVFPVYGYSRSAWSDYYEDDIELYPSQRQRQRSYTPPSRERQVTNIPLSHNALLTKYGIEERVGEKISYETYEFRLYKDNKFGNGEIIGWIADQDEYVELRICSINEKYFKMEGIATATIVSAYEYNKTLHIICRCDDHSKLYEPVSNVVHLPVVVNGLAEVLDPELSEEGEEEEVELVAESGQVFTREKWEKSDLTDCCYCSSPIPFEDVPKTSINSNWSFCSDCAGNDKDFDNIPFDVEQDLEARIEEVVTPDEVEGDKGEYCKACNTHHNKDVANGNITHEEYKKLDPNCKYHWSLSHQFKTISLGQLVKKPLGWCDICGVIHPEQIANGDFTLAYWNSLPVSCPVKLKYKDKFTKENRPTLCFDKNTRRVTSVKKVEANRRPIDIFYSVPCPVCTVTHSQPLVGGEVDHNVYINMIEGCPVKDYWMKEYNLK